MKKRSFAMVLALILALSILATALTGCSSGSTSDVQEVARPDIVVWVGIESVDFYQEQLDKYVADYATANGKDFPAKIVVQGVDTGAAASKFLDDTEAGADIFTIAHDNLGKLTAGSSAIAPIMSEALLNQINADNPDSFLNVIDMEVQGTTYTFGIPYIAQALVLFYNKALLSEEDVKTWEGIWEVAKANNMQSVSLMGNDGYNNSFILLANRTDGTPSTLKIYDGGELEGCYTGGDDTVAKMQWGQRFFTDKNGAALITDSGWEIELRDSISLSLIGGAWKFNAAKSALGENLGIAILPTFTLTEADVANTTMAAGTEFRSGTFADCKMFVIKKNSPNADLLEDILVYLSSKEMQEASFEACNNLPAYKNALDEFPALTADTLDAQLAARQVEMFQYGIPQPFGHSTSHNFYYYSKGGPDLINEILTDKDGLFGTNEAIRAQLALVENIWKTGNRD